MRIHNFRKQCSRAAANIAAHRMDRSDFISACDRLTRFVEEKFPVSRRGFHAVDDSIINSGTQISLRPSIRSRNRVDLFFTLTSFFS
jgi:hypothetical protein